MARGTVITAKGKRMDFAELERKARAPIQPAAQHEVSRQLPPVKQPRARGHIPSHAGVIRPNLQPLAAKPATRQVPLVENKSLADYTEITIDEPKHIKTRPEDPTKTANEALQEILSADKTRYGRQKAKA